MNIFAWNITIKGNLLIPDDFPYDYIENLSLSWDKTLYLFWETDFNSSDELVNYFVSKIWELNNFDISISTEDKIEVIPYDFEEWVYEVVSFEWEQITFEEIKDRFLEHDAMFSVREVEESSKFWNKVIRVDFIY
jgi:hypothetical protein